MKEKIFLASYLFEDKEGEPVEWSLEFYAKDFEAAKQKIKAIKETLKLDGELSEKIEASDSP